MKNELMIVGIGELLWDVFPEGKQLGGAPVNFAYHVSQFGLNAIAISALGMDKLGDEVVELLASKNINTLLERIDFPTGTVQVTVDARGIPSYEIKKKVAWDNIVWNSQLQDLASKAKVVCFGSLAQRNEVSRNTIHQFLDHMPEDSFKIFDINLRQDFYTKEIIENSLRKCNVLKLNDEELVELSRLFQYQGDDQAAVCKKIMDAFNLEILILTCGTEGSYVFKGEEKSFLPTPKVTVADTVGAGDSFTAAFCASVLKGKSIVEAHRKAVDVSAYVCTQNGAMPELPKE